MKTNADYLVEAIKLLKPNSEFSFQGSDYSTIKWDKLQGDVPSLEQIEQKIIEIKNLDAEIIAKKAVDKANALAKLAALGLTDDEAKTVIGS